MWATGQKQWEEDGGGNIRQREAEQDEDKISGLLWPMFNRVRCSMLSSRQSLQPTGKLDKRHAPEDAPYPADDDDERGQLQQPDDHVDAERSSLGLDAR